LEEEGLTALTSFARRVQSGTPPDQLIQQLLEYCVALAEADSGYVVLLEDGGATVVARSGQAESKSEPVLLSDTLLDQVRGRRQPLMVADIMSDPALAGAQSVIDLRLRAAIGLPLMRGDQLRGLIHLGSGRAVNRFDPSTLRVLEVFSAQACILVELAEQVEVLQKERAILRSQLQAVRMGRLIGACEGMNAVFERVERIARSDAAVMILGETGTGKELVAREIHDRSYRRSQPFVAINCGAIPSELLEAELFGHKKGAFTGASRDRKGRFVEADGGTLLLDEIGEMPLPLQVKLLRVLEEGLVTPVGSNKQVPVDLRVLSATHVALDQAVEEGSFREDLFYRLWQVDVHLPPLRERGEDILLLARAFLSDVDMDWSLGQEAISALLAHRWPGNVRELQNRIQRAVLLSDSDRREIAPKDLGLDVVAPPETGRSLQEAVERFRTRLVLETVAKCGGNRTEAARQLDVDPRTIFRYISRDDSGQEA
jgi:transcriptional regulator with GAF, ATPase, and Fis domain